MKPLVVANWKLHPTSRAAARDLFQRVAAGLARTRGVEVILAPPFPYLADGRRFRRAFRLCAQDVFWERSGPYTGEVSPVMLKDLGVSYVILGHSERRALGESDEAIARKVRATIAAGLVPVVAVGEAERESQEVVPSAIRAQLTAALTGIPRRHLSGAVIAYEPRWAISTARGGRADTPDNATRRAIYIRKLLVRFLGERVAATVRIIYGGSVTRKNAGAFVSRDIRGMEGVLVGAASLDATEFTAITAAVARASRW